MISMRTCNAEEKSSKGFTLIELIVVISIIAILCTIAVPAYIGYSRKAKEQVCNTNCLQLERMYGAYLIMEGIEHTEVILDKYLEEYIEDVCPDGSAINYQEEKIRCNVHYAGDGDQNDSDDGSVPFL